MLTTSEFTDEYQDWLDGTTRERKPGARWLDMTLGEMKHGRVLALDGRSTIAEAVKRMNDERQTAVLVKRGEHLVGIFTERDVLTRVVPRGVNVHEATVSELMTPDPQVFAESTLLSSALRTLALGSYHHLPVVDAQGRAFALVSLETIVAFLLDLFPSEIMNAPPERESFPPMTEGA